MSEESFKKQLVSIETHGVRIYRFRRRKKGVVDVRRIVQLQKKQIASEKTQLTSEEIDGISRNICLKK